MKQNPKLKNELNFSVCILEARFVTWSNPPPLSSFGTNTSLNNGYTGNQAQPASSTTVSTYVELYAFGPFQSCGKNWPMKIVPATYVDGHKKIIHFGGVEESSNGMGHVPPPSAFEFKVVLSSSDSKKLSETSEISSDRSSMNENNRKILEGYEIQMVMREIIASNGQTNVIGVAVFNLGESVQSAHVWKKLIREEQMKVDSSAGGI